MFKEFSLRCLVVGSSLIGKKEKLAEMVTHCHSLSFVVIRCHSLYHSLSLDLPLICLFINDPLAYNLSESNVFTSNYYVYKISFLFVMILMILKHLLEQTIHFEKE